MQWVRSAWSSFETRSSDLPAIEEGDELFELDQEIEDARRELQKVQARGREQRQRRRAEMESLRSEKSRRDEELQARLKEAKQHVPFREYANIICDAFYDEDADNSKAYTWFGFCEAWLLRSTHQAMMVKKQHDIVQKDCNEMLMDLYDTIPQIKEEQSLAEVVTLCNMCKMDDSSKAFETNLQKYIQLQQDMISKLTRQLESQQPQQQKEAQQPPKKFSPPPSPIKGIMKFSPPSSPASLQQGLHHQELQLLKHQQSLHSLNDNNDGSSSSLLSCGGVNKDLPPRAARRRDVSPPPPPSPSRFAVGGETSPSSSSSGGGRDVPPHPPRHTAVVSVDVPPHCPRHTSVAPTLDDDESDDSEHDDGAHNAHDTQEYCRPRDHGTSSFHPTNQMPSLTAP